MRGYVYVKPGDKIVAEHRLVMERVIGRPLTTAESVHHINGIRSDNREENLEMWVNPTKSKGGHLGGQRVADLVAWVVDEYPEYVEAALAGRAQLRLAG